MSDTDILIEFLNYPLGSGNEIINRFADLQETEQRGRPVSRMNPADAREQFVYISGKRQDKVVLVAHADTVWDKDWMNWNRVHKPERGTIMEHDIVLEGSVIRSGTPDFGIGADDRAGCAILWLLRESGHSLLITNAEEHNQLGSNWLMNNNIDIANELNSHLFMIQLDRRNAKDFKCYTVGTNEFREFISRATGYTDAGTDSRTDIVVLCKEICGVNFSIGYYDDHTENETIKIGEWQNTLEMVRCLVNVELTRFILDYQ